MLLCLALAIPDGFGQCQLRQGSVSREDSKSSKHFPPVFS